MKEKVSVLIAGDICLQDRTAEMPLDELCRVHDKIKHEIVKADYAIVNQECAVTEKGVVPIKKAGIALRNSTKVLDLIQYLGFNAVALANNHFADFGVNGVDYSLKQLQSRSIDYVGGERI